MVCSGTSMATPHVSGAFALLNQYLKLQNSKESTPEEIKNTLTNTGKIIHDPGTGLNFSRIDILSAIISLDEKNPEVNLISPQDSYSQFTQNITFSCYANDPQLSNITLYLWNSSGIYNNTETVNLEISGIAEFNITNIERGNYEWNCLAYDENNNFSFSDINYTFNIDNNKVLLNNPSNDAYSKNNQTFNCSSETDTSKRLSNMTFFLWNSTDEIYSETKNVSGTQNSTLFQYNFTTEQSYEWNCLVYNNNSESSFAISNHTLTYDVTPPNITIISPENSASYTGPQQITFEFNVSEPENNCSLLINDILTSTNNSINHTTTQQISETLNPGSYSWKIQCFDLAGNQKQSSSRSLTINSQQIISSSGGGGGTVPEKTYLINEEKSSRGYNQELQKDDKIIFYIRKEEHTITTKSVSSYSATFLIQSDTIEITLKVNEEKYFDLTKDNINDLYLKLNSIHDNKVNLTIKTIETKQEKAEETTEKEEGEQEKGEHTIVAFEEQRENNLNLYQLTLIIGVIIILIIILILLLLLKPKIKNCEANLGDKLEKTKTKPQGKEKIPIDKRKRRK